MEKNFDELWNTLSKSGIQGKRLLYRLTTTVSSIPQKLSATTAPYPGVIQRNVVQNDLLILSRLIFDDVLPSRELEARFLKECYAQSGQLSQFSLASRDVLRSRYAAIFPENAPNPVTIPAVGKDGISTEFLSVSIARQPILLLGDVGVGKTTFIRHLINIDAASVFENAIALHLNLGTQAALETDLRRYVQGEIEFQLRSEYNVDIYEARFVRATYASDMKRFEKGIFGGLRSTNPELYQTKELEELQRLIFNRAEHTRRSLEHLVHIRAKQVVIFLDNADQRDEPTQEAVFLIAQEISQQWPALVFVSLRPEAFNRSQKRGVLTGYHARAFTISPPRIDQALVKRLRFALKITRGEIPVTRLQNVGIKLETLTKIVLILLRSLDYDPRLFELLDNLSGGNIRAALELMTTFIGSGHVDTKKMLESYEKSGQYFIPPHEFMRAIIFGDSIHFDPNRPIIANLFDVSTNDVREHFLLPLLLGTLDHFGGTSGNNGFVDTKYLYDALQNMGFTADQIDFALAHALDKKLVQMSGRPSQMIAAEVAPSIRITPPGLYHVFKLSANFYYIDAVIIDTPILVDSIRESIRGAREIGDRLARAEHFIKDYLSPAWESVGGSAIGFDWPSLSGEALELIAEIRWKLANRPRIRRDQRGRD
jgi:hypothetical protein